MFKLKFPPKAEALLMIVFSIFVAPENAVTEGARRYTQMLEFENDEREMNMDNYLGHNTGIYVNRFFSINIEYLEKSS